jgi:hypothetical protein
MEVPVDMKKGNNDNQTKSSDSKVLSLWKFLRRLFPVYEQWRRLREPSTRWDMRSPADANIWFEVSNIWLDFHQPIQDKDFSNFSSPARGFRECQKRYQSTLKTLGALHIYVLLCFTVLRSLLALIWLATIIIAILILFRVEVKIPVSVATIVIRSFMAIPILVIVEFTLKVTPVPKLLSPGLKEDKSNNEESTTISGIVSTLRTRNCGDPRDKSYSLHGVLKKLGVDVSTADYNKPLSQNYQDLMVDLITWRPQLIFLVSYAGLTSSIYPAGPSWVPDWTHLSILSRLAPIKLKDSSQESSVSCFEPQFEIRGNELALRVVWNSKITYCRQYPRLLPTRNYEFTREQQEWSLQYVLDFIIWYQDKVMAFTDAHNADPGFQMNTPEGVRIRRSKTYDIVGNAIRKAFASFGYNPTINCSHAAYVAHFNRWWCLVYDEVNSVQQQRNSVSYLLEIIIQDEQMLVCQNICSLALQHIDLFITSDGDIGSGSRPIMPGDNIARIPGVDATLIFRELPFTAPTTSGPWIDGSYLLERNSHGCYVLVGRGSIHKELEEPCRPDLNNTEIIVVR